MNKLVLLVLLLSTGCANYAALKDCQSQAGSKPYAIADVFGAAGAVLADQTDDRIAWNQKVNDCMAKYKAANP